MQYSEIGLIVETPATYDEEGNVLTAATYKQGWHVNTLEPVPEWESYKITTPATPARIYYGNIMPVCYKFPDKQTFEGLLPEQEEF